MTLQTASQQLDVPLLVLFSENRSCFEAYRVPSITRVFNIHFPDSYPLSCSGM